MECTKTNFTKSIFLVINFVIWLLGLSLMVLGVYTRTIARYLLQDADFVFNSTNLLIATGVIVTALGFLGCVAAWMKVRYLLTVYALLLILVFVLEILVGIYTYDKRVRIQNNVIRYLYNGTKTYYGGNDPNSKKLTKDIDWFQERLQCCGMRGPADWRNSTWYLSGNKARNESVPRSCCREPRPVGCNINIDLYKGTGDKGTIFEKGCVERGKNYFMRKMSLIGGVIVFSSVTGVLGAILALFLCTAFQKDANKTDYVKINSN